jgi:hypothetical protein
MSPEISERSFEGAIECGLRQHGPDACTGDTTTVRELPVQQLDCVRQLQAVAAGPRSLYPPPL